MSERVQPEHVVDVLLAEIEAEPTEYRCPSTSEIANARRCLAWLDTTLGDGEALDLRAANNAQCAAIELHGDRLGFCDRAIITYLTMRRRAATGTYCYAHNPEGR